MKPHWHARFLRLAVMVGSWSKDPGAQVGCVLVNPLTKRVISLGFNGPPRGVGEVEGLTREQKLARTLHAEENAILFAAQPLQGCYAYVNYPPCSHCAAMLVQVGVREVHHLRGDDAFRARWADQISVSIRLLQEGGVERNLYNLEDL